MEVESKTYRVVKDTLDVIYVTRHPSSRVVGREAHSWILFDRLGASEKTLASSAGGASTASGDSISCSSPADATFLSPIASDRAKAPATLALRILHFELIPSSDHFKPQSPAKTQAIRMIAAVSGSTRAPVHFCWGLKDTMVPMHRGISRVGIAHWMRVEYIQGCRRNSLGGYGIWATRVETSGGSSGRITRGAGPSYRVVYGAFRGSYKRTV